MDRQALRLGPASCSTPTPGRSRRATTSARPPSCSSRNYQVRPAALAPGHLHQRDGQHRPRMGAHRRRPPGRTCRSSSAPTRSPRPRTSSTSSRSTSTSVCARCRPRTRSPASGRPSERPSAAPSGVTTTSGPRHRPQVRVPGPGREPRAPAARHRHPTRRALDRPAHQDRAVRSPPRHVRPPRGVAGAHSRPHDAVALLRRGRGGRAHRREVPDAGDGAVRRLPGQRGRAVAPARRGRPSRPPRGVRHRAQPHRR